MNLKTCKQIALRSVRSSVALTSALFFADGLWAKFTSSRDQTSEHFSGVDVEADYQYAAKLADLYLGSEGVAGRVAEVGPGGNAAVALNLLARGAASVDLIDRFAFTHQQKQLDALYRRFANYEDLRRVHFHTGEKAAAERFFENHRGFHGIFSCAVLEHLSDPVSALRSMINALEPGGRMVHQVDLRDHGMYTSAGKHDLTFLTIPDAFYRMMSEPRGRPNRITVDAYRDLLDRSAVDYRLLVTHLVGVGQVHVPVEFDKLPQADLERAREAVRGIWPKLARPFRDKQVDDLAVASFRIDAVKRDRGRSPEGLPLRN